MIQLRNFFLAKREQREPILEKIIEQNKGRFPQIAQQFQYMEPFGIVQALGQQQDVFSDTLPVPHAVGYRVTVKNGFYSAEPWVWRVSDVRKLKGVEIRNKLDNALYIGALVPEDMVKRHGTVAYSLMLGNMNLLKKNRARLVSM